MKELSIEEKAKAYDEAIERAKKWYNAPNIDKMPTYGNRVIEEIFPELKESEDDKIRAFLVDFIKVCKWTEKEDQGWPTKDACVAWLEKQGEHANFRNKIQIGDKVTRNEDGVLVNLSQLKRVAKPANEEQKDILEDVILDSNEDGLVAETIRCKKEKQGEQKPTDKVKPKFKEGDWVFIEEVKGYKNGPFKIKIVDSLFGYSFDEYCTIPFMYEDLLSKWTIQDAKDGDVLFMNNGSANFIVIYKSSNNKIINKYASYNDFVGFENEHYLVLNDGYVIPATKEQRDLLFQKMKEVGYEWDAEHKQLKKIEQKSTDSKNIDLDELVIELEETIGTSPHSRETIKDFFQKVVQKYMKCLQIANGEIGRLMDENYYLKEQKPTEWSEDDEMMISNIGEYLNRHGNYIVDNDEKKAEEVYKAADWLKSLKDRVQTKQWSEEDKNGFINFIP